MREHAHYFRVFCRERENRGLIGGASGIRNAGVARDLSSGKGARVLEIFGDEIREQLPEMSSPSVLYDFHR
jgi:2-phosphoglycerate kinase